MATQKSKYVALKEFDVKKVQVPEPNAETMTFSKEGGVTLPILYEGKPLVLSFPVVNEVFGVSTDYMYAQK